jgi:hypothetical protein
MAKGFHLLFVHQEFIVFQTERLGNFPRLMITWRSDGVHQARPVSALVEETNIRVLLEVNPCSADFFQKGACIPNLGNLHDPSVFYFSSS